MTITKKIALLVHLALSMQCITQAYDADAVKTELLSIAHFIQELRQQNNYKTDRLANWLESKVLDTANTTDNDIIAMATIATKYESKTESQIATLSKKISCIIAYLFTITIAASFAGFSYYRYLMEQRNAGWS